MAALDAELALMVDVLELLGAGPERQVAELDAFREVATQLREGVVDMVRLNDSLERRGALPPRVAAAVRRIDARFDAMIDAGESMFTEEAVRNSPEWEEVRRVARGALAELRR